ncbi:hypothetical protein KXV85_004013, partial [Aspergillus fumigatus]
RRPDRRHRQRPGAPRIQAVLPADLRPAQRGRARMRGAGALDTRGRQRHSAGAVHSACRDQRPDRSHDLADPGDGPRRIAAAPARRQAFQGLRQHRAASSAQRRLHRHIAGRRQRREGFRTADRAGGDRARRACRPQEGRHGGGGVARAGLPRCHGRRR